MYRERAAGRPSGPSRKREGEQGQCEALGVAPIASWCE
jgi:hypothetical protein